MLPFPAPTFLISERIAACTKPQESAWLSSTPSASRIVTAPLRAVSNRNRSLATATSCATSLHDVALRRSRQEGLTLVRYLLEFIKQRNRREPMTNPEQQPESTGALT